MPVCEMGRSFCSLYKRRVSYSLLLYSWKCNNTGPLWVLFFQGLFAVLFVQCLHKLLFNDWVCSPLQIEIQYEEKILITSVNLTKLAHCNDTQQDYIINQLPSSDFLPCEKRKLLILTANFGCRKSWFEVNISEFWYTFLVGNWLSTVEELY